MDFLAGALVGFAASTLFLMCLLTEIVHRNTTRMKRLEELIAGLGKKETWDEADYWKFGHDDEDEI